MRTSAEIGELQIAMSKVQAELKIAKKNADNPFYKSSYADLPEVVDACRPALIKHGIAVMQGGRFESGCGWVLETRLALGKQWIESDFPLANKDPNNPQAVGSSTTYAKRFALMAMVGVVTDDDDDGNAATKDPKPNNTPAASPSVRPLDKTKTPATERQIKFVYSIIKSIRPTDEAAKEFMFKLTGKTTSKELSQADVDKIAAAVEAEKAAQANQGDAFEDFPG